MHALWIVAAGSCIALGAGSGVAAASPDSTDSTDSGSAAASSTGESAQSAESAGPVADDNTGDNADDNTGGSRGPSGGTSVSDGPATSVSASTVSIRRDDDPTSEPAEQTPPTAEASEASEASEAAEASETADASLTSALATETAPASIPAGSDVAPDAESDAGPPVHTTEEAGVEQAVVEQAVVEQAVVAAPTAAQGGAAPAPAPRVGPLASLVLNVLSTFGLVPAGAASPAVLQPVTGSPSAPGVVTGVVVGRAPIDIPVGSSTYTGASDWYFPTQADGSVQAQGVMWLQHGFLGDKTWYSALAQRLAQQTNSVVVVTNIPSFPFFTCAGCTLSGVPMQQGVAALFVDPDRTALNASATAAGYLGALPERFVLTGHSAGGGLAAAAGGFYVDAVAPEDSDLLGVVMYDGVSSNGTFATAIASLDTRNIPVYQIAAPPQPWNANGQTTSELIALRPGQFVGDVLANGSHVDSLIGGVPLIDLISQILVRPSPAGNTEAVYTLAGGWINDMYAGRGPGNPLYGVYGAPDDYVVLGQAAAVVLGPPPVVDVDRYLGTWYEVGSVKQFFSIGLVNTKAVYTLNSDGTIRVENSGNYFVDNGPLSRIVGVAVPLNVENNRLNVTFFGQPASAAEPGNYWIVDLAPDYSWAVVTDSTGRSGFLLSRTPTVSDAFYQELLNRASAKGVNGFITRTRQPGAVPAPV